MLFLHLAGSRESYWVRMGEVVAIPLLKNDVILTGIIFRLSHELPMLSVS